MSACVVGAGALLIGQGVLWLCGRREWSWLGAPVGLAAMILVAVAALHVPGRAITVGLLLAVAAIASIVLLVRGAAMRPRPADLLAALPVAFLVAVPFLS